MWFASWSHSITAQASKKILNPLTLSWRRPSSYRNQSIDLPSKSMDWFLYDNGLRLERVKCQCSPHIETSHLIFCTKQLTGFYMRAALALIGLLQVIKKDTKTNIIDEHWFNIIVIKIPVSYFFNQFLKLPLIFFRIVCHLPIVIFNSFEQS